MFSFEEYLWGWGIYLLSAIALLVVFWRLTKAIPWFYFKQCLRLISATLLLTPAIIEDTTYFWSPAWVQGFLQLVFAGTEGFMPIGRHLLIAVCAVLIIYLVILIGNHHQEQMKTILSGLYIRKTHGSFLDQGMMKLLQIIFMYPLRVPMIWNVVRQTTRAIPYNTLLITG